MPMWLCTYLKSCVAIYIHVCVECCDVSAHFFNAEEVASYIASYIAITIYLSLNVVNS